MSQMHCHVNQTKVSLQLRLRRQHFESVPRRQIQSINGASRLPHLEDSALAYFNKSLFIDIKEAYRGS